MTNSNCEIIRLVSSINKTYTVTVSKQIFGWAAEQWHIYNHTYSNRWICIYVRFRNVCNHQNRCWYAIWQYFSIFHNHVKHNILAFPSDQHAHVRKNGWRTLFNGNVLSRHNVPPMSLVHECETSLANTARHAVFPYKIYGRYLISNRAITYTAQQCFTFRCMPDW